MKISLWKTTGLLVGAAAAVVGLSALAERELSKNDFARLRGHSKDDLPDSGEIYFFGRRRVAS